MYSTTGFFIEKDCNGVYDYANAHEYRLETEDYPTFGQLKELILQAVEIECLREDFFAEFVTEKDGEFVNRETTTVHLHVETTNRPSKYINWGNKEPTIFGIDREKSVLEIE